MIPERTDQVANRKRRGSPGGRPVSYDRNASRGRNVIERAFNRFKNWRAIATRYDKHATIYRAAACSSPQHCSGSALRKHAQL